MQNYAFIDQTRLTGFPIYVVIDFTVLPIVAGLKIFPVVLFEKKWFLISF